MEVKTEEIMAKLQAEVEDQAAFLETLAHCAQQLGFRYFAYTIFSGYPLSNPKMQMETNLPDTFVNQYKQTRAYLQDPVIEQAQHSTLLFQWDADFYLQHEELWQTLVALGIAQGWTQSVRDCYGRLGVLTFAGKAPAEVTSQLPVETLFLWLSQLTHKALRDTLMSEEDDAIKDVLTLREKNILRWCSEGKSSKEIAILLGISERTVNFHVSNSIKKLSVANKTAATAKAAFLEQL